MFFHKLDTIKNNELPCRRCEVKKHCNILGHARLAGIHTPERNDQGAQQHFNSNKNENYFTTAQKKKVNLNPRYLLNATKVSPAHFRMTITDSWLPY